VIVSDPCLTANHKEMVRTAGLFDTRDACRYVPRPAMVCGGAWLELSVPIRVIPGCPSSLCGRRPTGGSFDTRDACRYVPPVPSLLSVVKRWFRVFRGRSFSRPCPERVHAGVTPGTLRGQGLRRRGGILRIFR